MSDIPSCLLGQISPWNLPMSPPAEQLQACHPAPDNGSSHHGQILAQVEPLGFFMSRDSSIGFLAL